MLNNIKIASRKIGEGEPCFIIAEAGSNHDGKLDQAKRLIEIAAEAGADAIKFQSFKASNLFQNLKTVKLLEKLELKEEWYEELFDHAKKHKIILFFSVFDEETLKTIEKFPIPAYKIASYELMHFPLLKSVSNTKKPVIISTGMANYNEVKETVDYLISKRNNNLVILHCVSQYPTEPKNVNLKSILSLKEFGFPVGFSDHTLGIHAPIAAVTLGANVIEKHFTVDRNLEGPDHSYALEPSELKEMIMHIREVEKMLGENNITPSTPEIDERKWRRALYAKTDIPPMQIIRKEDLIVLRPSPDGSIPPTEINHIIGRKTSSDIFKGDLIRRDMLK